MLVIKTAFWVKIQQFERQEENLDYYSTPKVVFNYCFKSCCPPLRSLCCPLLRSANQTMNRKSV